MCVYVHECMCVCVCARVHVFVCKCTRKVSAISPLVLYLIDMILPNGISSIFIAHSASALGLHTSLQMTRVS